MRTFYRGDTTRFTWEKYVSIHLEAHRLFDDAKEPLSDTIKILNFKGGIRPEAGLESSLEVARGLPGVSKDFDKFINHLTEGVTNKRSRQEMFRQTNNNREVSAQGRSGRGGRGGRGRGRGRGYTGRGRGRGRGNPRKRPFNIPDKIIVEGTELYPSKTYSSAEYQNLSFNQRNELRKARYPNRPDYMDSRSISAAISQGIREALQANDDLSSTTQQTPHTSDQTRNNDEANVSGTASVSTSTDQFRNRRGRA